MSAQPFHDLNGYGHMRGAGDIVQHQGAGDPFDEGSVILALLLRAERIIRGQVRHDGVDPQSEIRFGGIG